VSLDERCDPLPARLRALRPATPANADPGELVVRRVVQLGETKWLQPREAARKRVDPEPHPVQEVVDGLAAQQSAGERSQARQPRRAHAGVQRQSKAKPAHPGDRQAPARDDVRRVRPPQVDEREAVADYDESAGHADEDAPPAGSDQDDERGHRSHGDRRARAREGSTRSVEPACEAVEAGLDQGDARDRNRPEDNLARSRSGDEDQSSRANENRSAADREGE
jgi:hypothetical protein